MKIKGERGRERERKEGRLQIQKEKKR